MATLTQATGTDSTTYRLSVEQYLKMIAAGVFPPGARVELLGGVLVQQMTKHAPHDFTVGRLGMMLRQSLPPPWIVREEKSLVLGRSWRPEPDLAIIRGPDTLYRSRDPRAADVGLLIEVAESSYAYDRGEKWRAYAAARIPFYWIVNLVKGQVEVYRDPAGRGRSASYRQADTFGPEAEVPVVIDGHEAGRLAVAEILP
jgi:Uma2 family endonuclease